MATYTPQQYAALLERVPEEAEKLLRRLGRMAGARIGGRAIGTYMRDAKGEGRRSPTDGGPLRILTGRLARAVAGARRRGSIEELTREPGALRYRLMKGVDAAQVPEAYNETGVSNGFGRGITIPARPFLAPALDDEADEITRRAQQMTYRTLRQLLA